MQVRAKEIEPAESIVEVELEKFLGWYKAHQEAALIKALKQKFETYRRTMLQKLYLKMPHLALDESKHLEKFSRNLINKALHPYIMKLKDPAFKADESLNRQLKEIFNLSIE